MISSEKRPEEKILQTLTDKKFRRNKSWRCYVLSCDAISERPPELYSRARMEDVQQP